MASTSALFETRGLTKRFGGLTAVSDLDISVGEGDLRCIIGPNGAGKSTFLKLVTGQIQPTKGRVIYEGEDITELPPHKRVNLGISLKFQVPSVYDDFTVRENLRIPLQRHHSGQDIGVNIDQTLEKFNLADHQYSQAANLAHGQRQWLEIAMAVALDPKLLLLDEPTAGMTIEETMQTSKIIHELNTQENLTLIVIEHDINFVREIAESVTVLHQGQVLAEAPMEEIEKNEQVREIYLGET